MTTRPIIWISANTWIAWQSERMADCFGWSRPSPSNTRCGFVKRKAPTLAEILGFDPAAFMRSLIKRGLAWIRDEPALTNTQLLNQKKNPKISTAERHVKIAAMRAKGMSKAHIAETLGMCKKTVTRDVAIIEGNSK